jgi:hypothetical protein
VTPGSPFPRAQTDLELREVDGLIHAAVHGVVLRLRDRGLLAAGRAPDTKTLRSYALLAGLVIQAIARRRRSLLPRSGRSSPSISTS